MRGQEHSNNVGALAVALLAAMVLVNGPVRNEISMNSGIGALGPYNHANATIGRAYGLLSANLQGGSVPSVTYMGCQGNNMAYNSVTFAEKFVRRSPFASSTTTVTSGDMLTP